MDDDTATLARLIGARVRQERQARRWTLDSLADAAGVSRRMLINVEQGAMNPSVGTLLKISDALGVGLPTLVEPPQRSSARVVRRGEGAVLWSSELGGRGVLLAGTTAPDVLELWEWILAPGDRHESEGHTAGTEEILQVQGGTVRLELGAEEFSLAAGDTIAFTGDIPHAYANAGEETARYTLAVFEPGVGVSRPGVSGA